MADKKYDLEEQLKSLGIEVAQLTTEIEKRAKQSMALLQQQTYGLLVQKAQSKLKSTREIYIQNLGMINESDNVYVVYLQKPAGFIEDGLPAGDMRPDILHSGKPPKISQEGFAYKTIPFKHNKSPGVTSRAQMQVQNIVKRELKARGLDKPIMVNNKPKLGKAATVDLIGPKMPTSRLGRPILAGLTIYQREHITKSGKTQLKRSIMTFRVISDKNKGDGSWERPELKGVHFFDEVSKEVDQIWDKMLNDIVGSVKIEVVHE